MDPFTIATVVVKVTAACISTAKTAYTVRNKYKNAPVWIVTICSETAVISACLSELQIILCKKQEFVHLLDSRPELMHALDASLTGCAVLFSCLDDELQNITRNRGNDGDLNFKGKTKAVWNHDRLEELLEGLHRQQSAINFLIQLVQVRSLENIMQALHRNRSTLTESIRSTKHLKQSHPGVDVPESIFSPDDLQSLYSQDSSTSGASEQEFDFDDVIVNSKVYRRQLAALRKVTIKVAVPIIERDLIDPSDSQTIIARQNEQMVHDLEGLEITQHKEDSEDSIDDDERTETNVPLNNVDSETNIPGKKVGKYTLVGTLKENSQGRVMLACDINNKQFAIKFIKLSNSSPPAKISREAAIVLGLSHPNIVHFCDIVRTSNYTGIVSDYASGGELFDYILHHKHLKDHAARPLFAQLLFGVGCMHKKGIVHRNLNLHNLLLDHNRNLIIGGFSGANTFGMGNERWTHFWATRLGTYLDRIIEDEHQRHELLETCGQPDVWSCGIILYALLAGHLPWNDNPANPDGDNADLLYKHITSSPITFPDYVTPHARDLIRHMLVPNPRERFDLHEVARHSWWSEYLPISTFIMGQPRAPGPETEEQSFHAVTI